MKHLFVILALLTSVSAQASEDFSIDAWHPGFRLLAGGGVNSSLYSSENEQIDGGLGLSFKTDFVYFLDENWGVDAGSSVKFNRINGYLLWDTQLTLGLRRNLPGLRFKYINAPYVRAFFGRSPTVIFTADGPNPSIAHEEGVSRMQFDGTVSGLTFGNLARTKAGTIWFTEISYSYQHIDRVSEIQNRGDVPEVVYQGPAVPDSKMYTLTLSFGALIF